MPAARSAALGRSPGFAGTARRLAAALAAALVGVLLATVPVATPASAQPSPVPAAQATGGSLVLVGGGLADDNAAVYRDIVRLAGGSGRARIGVVTAAASVPAEDPDAGTPDCNNSVCNGQYYAELFERYGAEAEWIPIDLDRVAAAEDPAVVARVEQLTGFFFGGGDQMRYVTTMQRRNGADSAVLAAIRQRLRAGAVVAGTSAGAQIQAGRDMITGGESYEGLRDGSEQGYFDDPTVLGYLPQGGFGFFQAGLLDTHFAARGRHGRSIRLASDTGRDRVFGLDENTALVVTGVGTGRESMRVLGTEAVHVFDLRSATAGGSWRIADVRWSRLTSGDGYDPAAWLTTTAKPRLTGSGQRCTVTSSDDVFGRDVLPGLAIGLAEQRSCRYTGGRTYERNPRFTVELTRGGDFGAFRSGATTSVVDVLVRIAPR